MKLRGEVTGIKSLGDELAVTVENVQRGYRPKTVGKFGPPFTFVVQMRNAKYYYIGRIVTVDVIPKP